MIGRAAEALVFVSLAVGLHMGAWSAAPQTFGGSAKGDPGSPQATVAAATAQHTAIAQNWQRPPDILRTVARPNDIQETELPVRFSAPQSGPTLPAAPTLAPVLPATLPQVPPRAAHSVPKTPTLAPSKSPAIRPVSLPQQKTLAKRPNKVPQLPDPPRDMAPVVETSPPPSRQNPEPTLSKSTSAAPAARPSGDRLAARKPSGQSGHLATQSNTPAPHSALRAKWGARIQRKVHRRMVYPRGLTGSGVARVGLTIDRTGRLTGLRLIRSSGIAEIDSAALKAVKSAGKFPAAPKELSETSYSFTLSLNYRP